MFEDEDQNSKETTDASQRKKSVTSQAEVERLLIKWIQDVLKGYAAYLCIILLNFVLR